MDCYIFESQIYATMKSNSRNLRPISHWANASKFRPDELMITYPPRRRFLTLAIFSSGALSSARLFAQEKLPIQDLASAVLKESGPKATALGYKTDALKVDKSKFRQRSTDQVCGSCKFYQGKVGEELGRCKVFGSQVAVVGWCSAWAKREVKS